jgi:serine/threonine protein kinase
MMRGIMRGLAKLHSHKPKSILHGDLKATNVLVMADGVVNAACRLRHGEWSEFGAGS